MPGVVDAGCAAHMVDMSENMAALWVLLLLFGPIIILALALLFEGSCQDKRDMQARKDRRAASEEYRPDPPLDDLSI